MNRNIEEVEFTIFDTETTGLEPKSGDRIIEIAAVRLKGGKKLAEFESLVNPHRAVSPAAFAVNRISPEMLDSAEEIGLVLPRFLDFIRGSCLCSYNAAFDIGFLDNELELIKQKPLDGIVVVDILKMAKRLMPGLQRYALWFVAQKLGVNFSQEHRAMADVEMAIEVFYKLKELLKNKEITDFKNFSNLFSISSKLLEDLTNQKISEIQQAIDLGVKLRIRYLSSVTAQPSQREIAPREIKRENNQYYLVAYCFLRNEERSFRLDGILHFEII